MAASYRGAGPLHIMGPLGTTGRPAPRVPSPVRQALLTDSAKSDSPITVQPTSAQDSHAEELREQGPRHQEHRDHEDHRDLSKAGSTQDRVGQDSVAGALYM